MLMMGLGISTRYSQTGQKIIGCSIQPGKPQQTSNATTEPFAMNGIEEGQDYTIKWLYRAIEA